MSLKLFGSIFVIGFFGCLCTFGQPKNITSREYFDGLNTRGLKYYERSRRVESTTETLENGTATKIVNSISEVLLPDRRRYYSKTAQGSEVVEIEQITIDYMQYTRKDGGSWTKVDLRQAGGGYGSGAGVGGSSRQCEQYSVENAVLNGVVMQLFDWLLIRNDGNQLLFNHSRKWVNEDGLPFRSEEARGKFYPREETWREVVVYEYDPNIKIEAPIK